MEKGNISAQSDISSERELEIDVIIGLEDLCKLKTGNMKWGNAGDPVAEETTLEYRFTRVIFGSGPSPYLLNATLQRHLKKYEEEEPAVVQNVLPNMYCDDLVSGAADSTQAIELKDKITEIMRKGGFQLHKWKTNHVEVRKHIEEKSDQKYSTTVTYAKESLGTNDSQSKILGLKWNPEEDT
eukprot:gene11071-19932_t